MPDKTKRPNDKPTGPDVHWDSEKFEVSRPVDGDYLDADLNSIFGDKVRLPTLKMSVDIFQILDDLPPEFFLRHKFHLLGGHVFIRPPSEMLSSAHVPSLLKENPAFIYQEGPSKWQCKN